MNQQKRLEILEAFASSKCREFDGFKNAYLEAHPEQKTELFQTDIIVPIEEKPVRKTKTKPVEAQPVVTDTETIEAPRE
jgi:hypothetical protein